MEGGEWLILANGPWPASIDLALLHQQAAFTLACDGALGRCMEMALFPDAVIGDGDSVMASHLERYRAGGGRVHLEASQEENDLAKALNMAVRNDAQRCIVLGATGGDRHHEMANLLACASSALDIRCMDDNDEMRFLLPSIDYSIEVAMETEFSLFAFPFAKNITLRGGAFPLTNGVLNMGSQGLHNRATQPSIDITYDKGRLMVMLPLALGEGAGRNGA
jgi:thiamine pyrophosphokinase